MQIVCFSYICMTVRTGTCGLTLGVHACLGIAEMEITNYLSIIFQIFYYYIIRYYYMIYYYIYMYMLYYILLFMIHIYIVIFIIML